MPQLPRLDYLTIGLAESEANAVWRGVVGPLFEPRPFNETSRLPVGSASGVVVGDLIVARVVFPAQAFRRDAELIGSTPGHFLFQLYNSGGFTGLINAQHVTVRPGQVALIDLRHEVDTLATTSDTVALIVPRTLLPGFDDPPLAPRLDAARNRLLAAHIMSLRERSAELEHEDVNDLVAHATSRLSAILDPRRAGEVTDEPALDVGRLALAEDAIRGNLASDTLSPEWLADATGTSRATLYRIFAPAGGVMRAVQEHRLTAARAALSDPLETRRLSLLAAAFGFRSKAHFSRSFRARFGVTASEFRAAQLASAKLTELTSPDILASLWNGLGSQAGRG